VRVWTKSACVVVAWVILLTALIAAAGMRGRPSPAQAQHRTAASITQVTVPATLTAITSPAAAQSSAAATPAMGYIVRPGDTLSGIAAAFAVRGSWPALYAANRAAIGPDPGLIQPGTVLVLPGQATPARYTVTAGDTLSGIAAALAVPGGWPALYAANRHAIGPDPDLIGPGTVLTIPAPAPAATRPPAPAPHPAKPAGPAHPRAPRASAGQRHRTAPEPAAAHARAGMPQWLLTMLVAVGVLIGAAFLAELILVITRRRRQAVTRDGPPGTACISQAADPGPPSGEEACIVLADYHRLVVMHSKADDKVYVLRPPGEDPRAILRVARLVLTEDPYEKLANKLGVPASWPMD